MHRGEGVDDAPADAASQGDAYGGDVPAGDRRPGRCRPSGRRPGDDPVRGRRRPGRARPCRPAMPLRALSCSTARAAGQAGRPVDPGRPRSGTTNAIDTPRRNAAQHLLRQFDSPQSSVAQVEADLRARLYSQHLQPGRSADAVQPAPAQADRTPDRARSATVARRVRPVHRAGG